MSGVATGVAQALVAELAMLAVTTETGALDAAEAALALAAEAELDTKLLPYMTEPGVTDAWGVVAMYEPPELIGPPWVADGVVDMTAAP